MSTTIDTVVKIMESLPESTQEQLPDHLREYIADVEDEEKWKLSFERTQSKLVAAAQQARKEIRQGVATPLDNNRL
jgi:hypothetical protein